MRFYGRLSSIAQPINEFWKNIERNFSLVILTPSLCGGRDEFPKTKKIDKRLIWVDGWFHCDIKFIHTRDLIYTLLIFRNQISCTSWNFQQRRTWNCQAHLTSWSFQQRRPWKCQANLFVPQSISTVYALLNIFFIIIIKLSSGIHRDNKKYFAPCSINFWVWYLFITIWSIRNCS